MGPVRRSCSSTRTDGTSCASTRRSTRRGFGSRRLTSSPTPPTASRGTACSTPTTMSGSSTTASPSPSTTPSPSPSPSASPSPSPIPVNAFLSLDVTAGGPTTQITVNGDAFLPNEQMTLYCDQATKIAGGANADGSGNFVTHVKPFSGDGPGAHKLCASVQPNPCATFTLDATPTSPSPSPSPSESPSPSASPEVGTTFTPSPSPVAATLNGIDVITSPPFVFLPIAGGLAILL